MRLLAMIIITICSLPLFFIGIVAAFLWKGVFRGYEMYVNFFNHIKHNM